MSVYKGNKEIDEVYLGSDEIAQIYLGAQEIWSKSKVIYLGEGTSFNVSSIYSKYADLTADNFMISGDVSTPSTSGSVSTSGESMSMSSRLNKSYNASTGVFSASHSLTGQNITDKYVGVKAWLVPNLANMVEKGKARRLGSGRSFNIKSLYPDDYQNFTIKNFLIQSISTAESGARYWEGSWTCAGYGQFPFSYDSATGILSAGNNLIYTNSGGGYLENRYTNAVVYFFTKAHA